jgi:hypothetical protein
MLNFEFVSFIGFILLTTLLFCKDAILNRVTVLFKISSLLEFISQRYKEPYYDKFSVTCIKRQFQKLQEDSTQLTTQQKSDPLFPFGRPIVSRRF